MTFDVDPWELLESDKMEVAPVRQPVEDRHVPFPDSLLSQHDRGLADAGLMMGRTFRVGWSPQGHIIHLAPTSKDTSPAVLKVTKVVPFATETRESESNLRKRMEDSLQIVLASTKVQVGDNSDRMDFSFNNTSFANASTASPECPMCWQESPLVANDFTMPNIAKAVGVKDAVLNVCISIFFSFIYYFISSISQPSRKCGRSCRLCLTH